MSDDIGFLFDLDGVIIDSETEYSKIWAQINGEFPTGIPELERKIKGMTLDKILNEYYTSRNERDAVARRLHELEKEMEYNFIPGAHEFLIQLKEKLFRIALVTSSDELKMQHLEEELPGITDIFDFIVTSAHVKTSKPSPEGYLLAAKKINVPPQYCVVFEDSIQGVMAGKSSGAFVVGVTATLGEEALKPYSDLMVKTLADIDTAYLIEILERK